ncbi:glutamine amidotransferase-related protein [Rhizobium laguerreae]
MPFIAVCLSHQILCRHFGLSVEPLRRPNQGLQRTIDYFGRKATVGF